jgi:hypothetical protein
MAVIGGVHGFADRVSHIDIVIGQRFKVLHKMPPRPARMASQRVEALLDNDSRKRRSGGCWMKEKVEIELNEATKRKSR